MIALQYTVTASFEVGSPSTATETRQGILISEQARYNQLTTKIAGLDQWTIAHLDLIVVNQ